MRVRSIVRVVVVTTIALAALTSSYAALSVLWIPRASLGFGASGLAITAIAPGSAADRAGIRVGDRLDAATSFRDRLRVLWYDDYQPGETQRLIVDRGPASRAVVLQAAQHPPPFDLTAEIIFALRLLTYVVFVFTGAMLVLLRPARFTWGFFLCCIGLTSVPGLIGWSLSTIDPPVGFALYCLWFIAADVACIGFLLFALAFPNDLISGWKRIVLALLPAWLASLIALDVWNTIAWFTGTDIPAWTQWANAVVGFAAYVAATLSLLLTYRSADPATRKRLLWAIVGTSVGFLGWYLAALLTGLGHGGAGRIAGLATLAIPLSVGYAVIKHRVVDVRFALNRALAFSVLATILAGILALSYWTTATLLQQSHAQLFVQIAVALVAGIFLQRTHRLIERAIRNALFRSRRFAEERLTRAAAAISAAKSVDAVEAMLVREPCEALELEFASIYGRGPDGGYNRSATAGTCEATRDRLAPDDPIVLMLEANPAPLSRALPSVVALPIADGANVFAIALYGQHRSGFEVDVDEVRILERLALAAAAAYRSLAARFARTWRLAELLRAAPDLSAADIEAFITDQILACMTPRDREIVEACAAVRGASSADVADLVSSEGTRARLVELCETTPFVQERAADRYYVHPALEAALRVRLADGGRPKLLRCAWRSMDERAYARAAELFLRAEDRPNALGALDAHYAAAAHACIELSSETISLVEGTAASELAAYPRLLEAKVRLVGLLADDPALRLAASGLTAWSALMWSEGGDQTRALELLDRHDAQRDSAAASDDGGFALAVRALICGKLGRLSECDDLVRRAAEQVSADQPESLLPLVVRARLSEGARGQWSSARSLLEGALETHADRSPSWKAIALAELVIADWMAGDEARCAADAQRLRAALVAHAGASLLHLAGNALGADLEPDAACYPRYAAFSWLMRAASADERSDAKHFAERAVRRGAASGEPFIEVLALVALAALAGEFRFDHLRRAAALANRIESRPLAEAVNALIGEGDAGMLGPFVERVGRLRPGEALPLAIEFATGCVRRGRDVIALSERELALALALARTSAATSRSQLIDMLWPDQDETNGTKALQTCVYRLRARIEDGGSIQSVEQGYRFRADVSVDLLNAEQFVGTIDGGAALDDFTAARLDVIARRFGLPLIPASRGWEWFCAVDRRIAALVRTARRWLALYHLAAGHHRQALDIARAMIAADDFDELGRELAIRAHLAGGDVAEGLREYRMYSELLARELSAEPAPSLASLVNHANGRTR